MSAEYALSSVTRSSEACVGVVVIGRNEGERLRRCLQSLVDAIVDTNEPSMRIAYVDSGSTDGSPELARGFGVEVIRLDGRSAFSAARARNAGVEQLLAMSPSPELVQFIDGDCELDPRWIECGRRFLLANRSVAVVSGRLRERHPERSIYNLLCDIEWFQPPGNANGCGGVSMMRIDALCAAGGFRANLIAGEEPELCFRLRQSGWTVWRLADDMANHDAAMTRWQQWWRRAVRGGYAYAEGAALHGALPERYCLRESRRALLWGLAIPMATLAMALLNPWFLMATLIYPAQVWRLARRGTRTRRENWLHALFLVLSKFPEAFGQLRFWTTRLQRRKPILIEYK